jgi:hypothetical protein
MLAHALGLVMFQRTRMRLFLFDANLGQVLDQNLSFDLEFARELVDANLTGFRHPLGLTLRIRRS